MPITAQALKKLRHDKKRSLHPQQTRLVRSVVKDMQKRQRQTTVLCVCKLDKAVKMHVIHATRPARLKSRLSKLSRQVTITPALRFLGFSPYNNACLPHRLLT
jgi:ribosomal protein S20